MIGLLDMVALDVGDVPDVLWILTERMPRHLPFLWALKMLLSWVFRRDANCVELEIISVGFGIQEEHLIQQVLLREDRLVLNTVLRDQKMLRNKSIA